MPKQQYKVVLSRHMADTLYKLINNTAAVLGVKPKKAIKLLFENESIVLGLANRFKGIE